MLQSSPHVNSNASESATEEAESVLNADPGEQASSKDASESSVRRRISSMQKVDAKMNNTEPASEPKPCSPRASAERKILKKLHGSAERAELFELLRKGLIGKKKPEGSDASVTSDDLDPATCDLVSRVAYVEIESRQLNGMMLAPTHMILPDGSLEAWSESTGISFLIPAAVRTWEDARNFVEESLNKWFLEGLHFRIQQSSRQNSVETRGTSFDDFSSIAERNNSESESDAGTEAAPPQIAQVLPISRDLHRMTSSFHSKSASFLGRPPRRNSRTLPPIAKFGFADQIAEDEREDDDNDGMNGDLNHDKTETKSDCGAAPQECDRGSKNRNGQDLDSTDDETTMRSRSESTSTTDSSITTKSISDAENETKDSSAEGDSAETETAGNDTDTTASDEEELDQDGQYLLAVRAHPTQAPTHELRESKSRFPPYRESIYTYAFRAKIHGLDIESRVAYIRSSIHRVKESPTLAVYRTQVERCPARLRLCWEWISSMACKTSSSSSSSSSSVDGCISANKSFKRARSLSKNLNTSDSVATLFSFLPFLLQEMKAQAEQDEIRIDVLRKILAYKCRFTTSQIDDAFFKSGIDQNKICITLEEVHWLAAVLEDVMIAWDNDEETDSLSEADLRVIRGLCPDCCSVRIRKLAGGFSGSLVLHAICVDVEGRVQDATVLKLDTLQAIEQEEHRHRLMLAYLGDHAPQLHGKFLSSADDRGGIKISLAGGGQSVFRGVTGQNTNNQLITLKDLYLYEQKQIDFRHDHKLKTICLDRLQRQEQAATLLSEMQNAKPIRASMAHRNACAMHSVHNVLLECFGEIFEKCTVQSSMSGKDKSSGDVRALYDIEGALRKCVLSPERAKVIADSVWDPFLVASKAHLWSLLGLREAPRARSRASDSAGALFDFLLEFSFWINSDEVAEETTIEFYEGMGHGDLNAANIVIDAQSIPWLIDFAQSGKHHVLQDLCKMTSCILFEYLSLESTEEMQAAVLMLEALSSGYLSLQEPLSDDLDRTVLDPLVKASEDQPERDIREAKEKIGRLQFAWQCCKLLRGYCAKYARDAADIRQWHAAMAYYAARAVSYRDTSTAHKQLALAGLLLHAGELMGLRKRSVPQKSSFSPQTVPLTPGLVVTNRLRDEVHMRSYLNRIALKCGHHFDPISGEVFNIGDTLDLDVESAATKSLAKKRLHQQQQQQQKQQEEGEFSISSQSSTLSEMPRNEHSFALATSAPARSRSMQRKSRPPPLQLGSTCTNVAINERSTRFFDLVQQQLGVDLIQARRVAICGPSSSGKTIVMKKLVAHALAEQDYYMPVFVDAIEICKFLRQRVEIARSTRSKSTESTASDYIEFIMQSNNESTDSSKLGSMKLSQAKSKFTFGESTRHLSSINSRPLSTITRAAHFFADQNDGSGQSLASASPMTSTGRRKRGTVRESAARTTGIQQRDLLRMHHHELMTSPNGRSMVLSGSRAAARSSSVSDKTGRKRLKNAQDKDGASHSHQHHQQQHPQRNKSSSELSTRSSTYSQQVRSMLESPAHAGLMLGVMELFWAHRYGEGSPMFNLLLKALENGQMLLFVDGLDDMRPETRVDLLAWIESQVDVIAIITARRERDIKVCLSQVSFVHVKPLSQDHVSTLVKSHVRLVQHRLEDGQLNIAELERFLLTEIRKPVFKEIVSGTPVLVKMLVFALTNHWHSTMHMASNEANLLRDMSTGAQGQQNLATGPNGTTEYSPSADTGGLVESELDLRRSFSNHANQEAAEDLDWGVPKILSYAVRHLLKSPVAIQPSRHLAKCSQLCQSEEGQSFMECMALALHLQRHNRRALGVWCAEALTMYAKRGGAEANAYSRGARIANAISALIRNASLPLFHADATDHNKLWMDRHARFAIHVLQEYLVAAYVVREVQEINPSELKAFIFELNLTAKDHIHLSSAEEPCPEFSSGNLLKPCGRNVLYEDWEIEASGDETGCTEDEESDNPDSERADLYSDPSLSESEDDDAENDEDTLSVLSADARNAERYRVRKIKLLSDHRWQPVYYLVQKMLVPLDVTGSIDARLLISFSQLLGPARFPAQLGKYVRYVVRNGDLVLFQNLLKLLKENVAAFNLTLDQLAVPIFAHIEANKYTPIMMAARRGEIALLSVILDFIDSTSEAIRSAVLDHVSPYGETALSLAAEEGQAGCLGLLLKHGAKLDANDASQCGEAIYQAAYEQEMACVKLLLEHGANPDASYDGTSCLFNAAFDGNGELCQILIDHGASRTLPSDSGHLPIHAAMQEEHTHLYELLQPNSP